jgi:hypothetical protein
MAALVSVFPVRSTIPIAVAPAITDMYSEKSGAVWKSVPVVSVLPISGVK